MSVPDRSKDGGRPLSKHGRVGPYSRWLRSGALGRTSGSSAEGRYLRDAEAQLTAHLRRAQGGSDLSAPQRMICARLARVMLRMELLDEKIADGKATELDMKILGGLSSQFRLMLREIGIKPAAQSPNTALLDALRGDAA